MRNSAFSLDSSDSAFQSVERWDPLIFGAFWNQVDFVLQLFGRCGFGEKEVSPVEIFGGIGDGIVLLLLIDIPPEVVWVSGFSNRILVYGCNRLVAFGRPPRPRSGHCLASSNGLPTVLMQDYWRPSWGGCKKTLLKGRTKEAICLRDCFFLPVKYLVQEIRDALSHPCYFKKKSWFKLRKRTGC